MTYHVGIYVFDNVEVLDFAGPYEAFTCATRVAAKEDSASAPLFEVFTIGASSGSLRARAGLLVQPDYSMQHHPAMEVLIIPGGVVDAELVKPALIEWIEHTAADSRITASVCTGAFLLARAGLLTGRRATTHWEDLAELQRMFPALRVVADWRWVDEGPVITSGGISAGIDMSLHIVERLASRALAQRTARQMEFDWTENGA